MQKKIVIATGNENKVREIGEIFDFLDPVSQRQAGFSGDVEETGSTFEENALIKARAVAKALNCTALADDSGLCVNALSGAPGIFSARYSGEHGDDRKNREKLLFEMQGKTDRSAKFVSAVALVTADGREFVAVGETHGKIMDHEEGENGFGYDCLFYSDDLQKPFGVATATEKNAVSHRYRALMKMRDTLTEVLGS